MAQSERETLARALLPCKADPDPTLRNGADYAALSQILRSELIGAETVAALKAALLYRLAGDDTGGFARPVAARTLAEMARTDQVTTWMTGDGHSALIAAAHAYSGGPQQLSGLQRRRGLAPRGPP